MAQSFKNLIGGRWVDAASGGTFEDRNPADRGDLLGTFPRSDAADVARGAVLRVASLGRRPTAGADR